MYKRTKFFDPSYYNFIGSWAWIFHRLSGLALIFYLTLHIWVVNTLTMGPEEFNGVMGFLSSPVFKFLEVGLWAAILFHAFNGVRIVIVDFSNASLIHKRLFGFLIGIAFIMWVIGSYFLIAHIKW